MFKLFHL